MIVDTMSYSEIRMWLFDHAPSSDSIIRYMEKPLNLYRACRKNKYEDGHIFNSFYRRKIENVTYTSVFSYNKKENKITVALFAMFPYRKSISIVSLNPDRRIMWYTRHFRERIIERFSDKSTYSIDDFLKCAVRMMRINEDNNYLVYAEDIHIKYGSGIIIVNARIPNFLFYITYIKNVSEIGITKRIVQSAINKALGSE